jgi:GDP-L-fucose synthase
VLAIPTNLYGPNDNYDLSNCHVLPALIRKAHAAKVRGAKELVVWGSGQLKWEFLKVVDMADGCAFQMESEIGDGLFNVGSGADVTNQELKETMVSVVGFRGEIGFDASKPDRTPRKLLNVERMHGHLGWRAQTALGDGIRKAYADLLSNTVV